MGPLTGFNEAAAVTPRKFGQVFGLDHAPGLASMRPRQLRRGNGHVRMLKDPQRM